MVISPAQVERESNAFDCILLLPRNYLHFPWSPQMHLLVDLGKDKNLEAWSNIGCHPTR